jgi:hypothetical protein
VIADRALGLPGREGAELPQLAAQSLSLLTSRREKIACSPSSSANVRPSCSSTSVITTFAPSATKPRTLLAPNPRAPPVTIAV